LVSLLIKPNILSRPNKHATLKMMLNIKLNNQYQTFWFDTVSEIVNQLGGFEEVTKENTRLIYLNL
jgi:hypothetical protein